MYRLTYYLYFFNAAPETQMLIYIFVTDSLFNFLTLHKGSPHRPKIATFWESVEPKKKYFPQKPKGSPTIPFWGLEMVKFFTLHKSGRVMLSKHGKDFKTLLNTYKATKFLLLVKLLWLKYDLLKCMVW